MPRGPNGNVNETLSLRKRFSAMWMSWIREYFACLAGLPLFPVESSWFVSFFGSSNLHTILYIVNLGCAPASLSLPSDSIVWPVWLFFRSTWTRVVLCLFLTSRMSARHCYTQSQCVFILDGDTLWYIAFNGSEVQPKQEVVPRPAHDLGQWTLKWNAFTTALQILQNLRRHPWSSRGWLHFKVRRPCLRRGCTCHTSQMFWMFSTHSTDSGALTSQWGKLWTPATSLRLAQASLAQQQKLPRHVRGDENWQLNSCMQKCIGFNRLFWRPRAICIGWHESSVYAVCLIACKIIWQQKGETGKNNVYRILVRNKTSNSRIW